jgi:hypothetical protein
VEVASGGVGFLDFGMIGAGAIVNALNGSVMSLTGVLANSGTLEGTGSGRVIINAPDIVTNAGTMKSTASGGLVIAVEVLNNSMNIEALGDGATVRIQSGTVGSAHFLTFVNNFGAGMIFASGSGAEIELDDATINNGTVKAVGSNARIVMSDSDSILGATIAAGTLVDIVSGADVQLSGTIGSGALIEVTGSALLNLLSVANSGTVLARDSGSKIFVAAGAVVRGGAIVAQGSGSEVEIFDGATVSGGTLFASGSGSRIDIVSGAVVKGGVAKVGDGLVTIVGSSSENVAFLSTGNGGLAIADTSGHATAFNGRVFGFGGTAHANKNQFIDLISVTSAANTISLSYVPLPLTPAARCSCPREAFRSRRSRWSASIRRAISTSPPAVAGRWRSPIRRCRTAAASRPGPHKTSLKAASACRTSRSERGRRLPMWRTLPAPEAL